MPYVLDFADGFNRIIRLHQCVCRNPHAKIRFGSISTTCQKSRFWGPGRLSWSSHLPISRRFLRYIISQQPIVQSRPKLLCSFFATFSRVHFLGFLIFQFLRFFKQLALTLALSQHYLCCDNNLNIFVQNFVRNIISVWSWM